MTEAHVLALAPQRDQAGDGLEARARLAIAQAELGEAWAVLADDEVIAVAGVTEAWEGRGIAWSLLSESAGRHMVSLTRAVRRYLDGLKYRRLEMYVDAQFSAGCRWAGLLGFERETPKPMRSFTPNGNAAYLYGRI